ARRARRAWTRYACHGGESSSRSLERRARVSLSPPRRATQTAPAMDLAELEQRLRNSHAGAAGTPDARRAAVALILRGAEPEVLLMRRSEREGDRWSGQIGLPGGHADALDEDLLATARREAREEVGLDLAQSARLLGSLAPVQAKARGYLLPMWITPFVFAA